MVEGGVAAGPGWYCSPLIGTDNIEALSGDFPFATIVRFDPHTRANFSTARSESGLLLPPCHFEGLPVHAIGCSNPAFNEMLESVIDSSDH
jgi:hypothetical protein